MPVQHLCFCVHLVLWVSSSDSAQGRGAVGKPGAVQLIQGLSESMALKTFFSSDVNPCFNSPLLKIVAVTPGMTPEASKTSL